MRNQFFVNFFPLSLHRSAFEVTFIQTSNHALCRQKEFVYSLKTVQLYKNDTFVLILFPPVTARLFSVAAPFLAFSILTILLDKCQMKSFENINTLIEIKLFCLKNVFLFFGKSFMKKNCYLKQKNFPWKKTFLKEKNFRKNAYLKKYLKKSFFFEKQFFFEKKNF